MFGLKLDLKQAKQRWLIFQIAAICAIIFTAISIGCFVAEAVLANSAYRTYTEISPATDAETRKASYYRAIKLAPERSAAYALLLDIYNEDGAFSKAESEEFLSVYNANHDRLRKGDADYANLHYTAGFLYVNGYESTSSATRLRMALPFLEAAQTRIDREDPYFLAVECYCRIGGYYRDYIWDAGSVREVSAKTMQSLVADIQTTLNSFNAADGDNVFNRLGFCVAVCDLFYAQRDILAATVEQPQVQAVFDSIYADLPNMDALQKEQTRALLQTLIDNETTYREMVMRAYERKGE